MTQSQVPDKWQADHVFVLVGGNPLPNYVAGRLLLQQGGTLHLVHSPETADIAIRIAKHFDRHLRHEVENPANDRDVEQVLRAALKTITGNAIALNYTGGTKAMAVHAHRTISGVLAKQRQQGIFTYLDAQTLSLRRDETAEAYPVQFAVKPAISTLLELHGIELKRPARDTPRREKLNQALAEAHATQDGQNAYEAWCQRHLRCPKNRKTEKQARSAINEVLRLSRATPAEVPYVQMLMTLRASLCCQGELVKKCSRFPRNPIPFPTDPSLRDVAQAMRKTFGINEDSFDPQVLIDNPRVGLRSINDLTHYLDGDWVEHLALAAFIANEDSCHLHDYAMSLDTTEQPYNFEFDVAAMQGYQLYAVSCTRSNQRHICKSKLFEAYVRAAQLGGDEAKVGLICCDRAPGILEDQVTEVWRAQKGRIRVFGPQDMPHLPARFYDWLSR